MSCFCTADGRVIHAVSGPVDKFRLLQEAQWAVDVYQQIKDKKIEDVDKQAQFVQAAHLAELGVLPGEFETAASYYLPIAQETYEARVSDYDAAEKAGITLHPVPSVYTLAKRFAAHRLEYRQTARRSVARVHATFAAQPLASISDIGARVFEYFAGEQFVKNRDRVYLAAKGVSLAKEQRRPLVFVFYRETIINRLSGKQDVRRPRADAQSIMDEILAQKKKSKEWQDAVIVFLPAREQPALTQLVDLPTYQLDEFSMHSTVIVVADPDGNQVVAEGGHLDFDKLAKGFLTASSWAAEERRRRAAKPLD